MNTYIIKPSSFFKAHIFHVPLPDLHYFPWPWDVWRRRRRQPCWADRRAEYSSAGLTAAWHIPSQRVRYIVKRLKVVQKLGEFNSRSTRKKFIKLREYNAMWCKGREIKCFLAFRAAEPSSLAFRDEKMSARLGEFLGAIFIIFINNHRCKQHR